jgi:hypothetical protein
LDDIQNRGPPAGTQSYSTVLNEVAYAPLDENMILSGADGAPTSQQLITNNQQLTPEGLKTSVAPNLPGLTLVDPDISSWRGQIVYLDFDEGVNVTYQGPVTVGPFDVPAFTAPAELAGQEDAIIAQILQHLDLCQRYGF